MVVVSVHLVGPTLSKPPLLHSGTWLAGKDNGFFIHFSKSSGRTYTHRRNCLIINLKFTSHVTCVPWNLTR